MPESEDIADIEEDESVSLDEDVEDVPEELGEVATPEGGTVWKADEGGRLYRA